MTEWRITLQIPKEEVWFVQHTLESLDGIALMTTGNMQDKVGWFDIYLFDSALPIFQQLIDSFQVEMPLLKIMNKEICHGL